MSLLSPTTLETHLAGGAVNIIVNGNWEILNAIFKHDTAAGTVRKLMAMGLLKLTEAQLDALTGTYPLVWNASAGDVQRNGSFQAVQIVMEGSLRLAQATKLQLVGDPSAMPDPIAPVYAAADHPRGVFYCSDGDGGNPCLCVSNGTDWKIIAFGATLTP